MWGIDTDVFWGERVDEWRRKRRVKKLNKKLVRLKRRLYDLEEMILVEKVTGTTNTGTSYDLEALEREAEEVMQAIQHAEAALEAEEGTSK